MQLRRVAIRSPAFFMGALKAMSEPNVHRVKAPWIFGAIGAVGGSIGCAYLGYVTGRSDWSPPLDAGDMRVFVLLSALTGILPGAFTGLAFWVATLRGLPVAARMASWGLIGGWLVLLYFFVGCFNQPPGIGGPVIFRRDIAGFWDRLVAAILVPLAYGAWILAGLGVIAGAVAAAGWSLLGSVIRRAMSRRGVAQRPTKENHSRAARYETANKSGTPRRRGRRRKTS
jgi:hypothetical protein